MSSLNHHKVRRKLFIIKGSIEVAKYGKGGGVRRKGQGGEEFKTKRGKE